MGLYRDGASPTGAKAIGGEIALDPLMINLHSGHVFHVSLAYDGANLTATVLDESSRAQMNHVFPVDIPSVTGTPAHVGFTAGTGMLSANFDLLSWDFMTM
jgi:hypothetical protein